MSVVVEGNFSQDMNKYVCTTRVFKRYKHTFSTVRDIWQTDLLFFSEYANPADTYIQGRRIFHVVYVRASVFHEGMAGCFHMKYM